MVQWVHGWVGEAVRAPVGARRECFALISHRLLRKRLARRYACCARVRKERHTLWAWRSVVDHRGGNPVIVLTGLQRMQEASDAVHVDCYAACFSDGTATRGTAAAGVSGAVVS